jgi:hypothetical protein
MDITQLKIKLPYDMMLEEQKERKERKDKARVFSFLIDFKEEIEKCNAFIEFHTPYPTILQEHKNDIRNRIRQIKQFYYEFYQQLPQHSITIYQTQADTTSQDICALYAIITTLISTMNTNIQCISEKTVIYPIRV